MNRWLLAIVLLTAACGGGSSPDTDSAPPAPSIGTSMPQAASASPPQSPPSSPTPSPSDPETPEPTNVGQGAALSGREAAVQAGVDLAGAVAGLEFRDANGVNVVVLRQIQTDSDASLLADHVALTPMTEERRLLRSVRDGVQDCEVDVLAEFVPGSLEVRNDDGDDLGEVVFAYRLACRGDVSPAEQKLLVLEDRDKHILRGSTSTPYDAYEQPKPEPAAADWPDGSYDWAQTRFRQLAPEFVEPSPN